MKYLGTLLVLALGIVLLIQDGGTAGTPPSVLRTVPVNVMEVMQPSKMVAVSFTTSASPGLNQIPLTLPVGQVFVLTSWSVNGTSTDGRVRLIEGPAETLATTKDTLFITTSTTGYLLHQHHIIPTGIRFPRDAAGLVDGYVAVPGGSVTVSVQGYITDDF